MASAPITVTFQVGSGTPYSLQTADPTNGVISSHIYDDAMPDIRLVDTPTSRQDGFKAIASYWGQKSIKVDGLIKSVTASGLDGQIDLFKRSLYPQVEGQLIVGRGTGDRLYNSWVKSVSITRDSTDITRAPFQVEFVCEGGFGLEPTYIATTTFSGITSSSFRFDIATSGTAPFKPLLQFKVQAASQLGNVTILNQTTNDQMTIARQFSVGEILAINSELAQVTVAGSGITYSGVLPKFLAQSGVNSMLITSASGTQTYDFSVEYTPKWL